MPRRSGGRGLLHRGGDTVTIRGSFYYITAVANGAGIMSSDLYPGLFGANLTAIADEFLEYRFVTLAFHAVNLRSANDCFMAVSVPRLNGTPASISAVSELERAFFFPGNNTVKLSYRVPKAHLLADQLVWYRNQPAGGTDDSLEYQGTVVVAGLAAAGQALMQVEYVLELRSKCPLATTVARIRALVQAEAAEEDEKELPVDWEAARVRVVEPSPASTPNSVRSGQEVVIPAFTKAMRKKFG